MVGTGPPLEMKKCTNCLAEKSEKHFYLRKNGRPESICRECISRYSKKYRDMCLNGNWKFPYKGLNDPKYIKDRDELFMANNELPMTFNRTYSVVSGGGVPTYKVNLGE